MYESSYMDSFARGTLNDKNRYWQKEISTVDSQTGAESIAELNNQTMQSPGQWAFAMRWDSWGLMRLCKLVSATLGVKVH